MRYLLAIIPAIFMWLSGPALYSQAMSISEISSDIANAFLEKPATTVQQEKNGTVAGRPATGIIHEEKESSLTGKEWQAKLETILDIPKAPLLDGLILKMLCAPGSRYIAAVYNTGEENVVRKVKQINWPMVRMLFGKDPALAIHVVPASGGTFSAGSTFYTITNEPDGFSILYMPQRSVKKVAVTFIGNEGAFLTPDGYVCRVRKHVPDSGGRE